MRYSEGNDFTGYARLPEELTGKRAYHLCIVFVRILTCPRHCAV